MKQKKKINKNFNINQKSFYFEDYLETNQKNRSIKNSTISQDRIYLLFFLFFSLIVIFAIKVTFISFKNPEIFNYIVKRVNRSYDNVFKLINNIDKLLLTKNKQLTIPLIKELI